MTHLVLSGAAAMIRPTVRSLGMTNLSWPKRLRSTLSFSRSRFGYALRSLRISAMSDSGQRGLRIRSGRVECGPSPAGPAALRRRFQARACEKEQLC